MGLSAGQQKFINSLHIKKYRREAGAFIAEGDKIAAELLQQERMEVTALYAEQEWADKNDHLVRPFLSKLTIVQPAELKKISAMTTPQGVLAVVKMPALEVPLVADAVCLYLNDIQDPGNLGTILRTADWFGLAAVYCSPDCADVFNTKTIQAGMGAFLRVSTREIPLSELLAVCPDRPVWGAVLGGQSLHTARFGSNDLLVIGNEGGGIRPDTLRFLTHRVTIPRHPQS
jgi:TrmH family RNA methyltransferase